MLPFGRMVNEYGNIRLDRERISLLKCTALQTCTSSFHDILQGRRSRSLHVDIFICILAFLALFCPTNLTTTRMTSNDQQHHQFEMSLLEDPSTVLSLETIRSTLIRLEDTIIFCAYARQRDLQHSFKLTCAWAGRNLLAVCLFCGVQR